MKRNAVALGMVMLLAAAPATARADKPDSNDYFDMALDELMQLNVATGTPRTLRDAPAVATVITAQDIQAMGARTLEEALAMVPGLHVSHSSPFMSPKFLFRGIGTDTYNPQTLVLLNGVPQTSLVRGDRGNVWRWLPVGQIARIEVIRGPGSAIYGADAFGGVINLITFEADSLDRDDVGLRLGSYRTREAWTRQSFTLGDWRGMWSAQWLATDGPEEIIRADAQTRLDAISASRPGVDPTPRSLAPGPTELSARGWELDLDLRNGPWRFRAQHAERSDLGMAVGVAEALDRSGRYGADHSTLELAYTNSEWRPDWGLDARLSQYSHGQEGTSTIYVFPPGAFAFAMPFPEGVIGKPEFDERTWRLDAVLTYEGFEHHRLRLGLGWVDANVFSVRQLKNSRQVLVMTPTGPALVFIPLGSLQDVSDTPAAFMPEGGRRSKSVFVQDEWQLGTDWQFVYGVRHDRYSDFGGSTNPRAALVWNNSATFTSKLMYGSAFRAPSWCELHCVNNPVTLGNPDLKPERLRNLELAFAWMPNSAWMVGLNLFEYRISDGIQFRANQNGRDAQNVLEQHGRGAELEFRYRHPDARWSVMGNASYARAVDQTLDVPVGLAPERRTYLRFDWKFDERLSLDLQATAVGKRKRLAGDVRAPLAGYVSVDGNVRWQGMPGGAELNLGLRNLFDADVREPASPSIPDDLPQPGRNLWLSIAWPL